MKNSVRCDTVEQQIGTAGDADRVRHAARPLGLDREHQHQPSRRAKDDALAQIADARQQKQVEDEADEDGDQEVLERHLRNLPITRSTRMLIELSDDWPFALRVFGVANLHRYLANASSCETASRLMISDACAMPDWEMFRHDAALRLRARKPLCTSVTLVPAVRFASPMTVLRMIFRTVRNVALGSEKARSAHDVALPFAEHPQRAQRAPSRSVLAVGVEGDDAVRSAFQRERDSGLQRRALPQIEIRRSTTSHRQASSGPRRCRPDDPSSTTMMFEKADDRPVITSRIT